MRLNYHPLFLVCLLLFPLLAAAQQPAPPSVLPLRRRRGWD